MSNASKKHYEQERSILSVVFFSDQLQIMEQASPGAQASNLSNLVFSASERHAEFYTQLSQFFKPLLAKPWQKIIALLPSENYLLVPTIFYSENEKDYLFTRAKLSYSGVLNTVKPVKTNSHLIYSFNHKLEMFLHNNFPGIEIYTDVHWLINHCMLQKDPSSVLINVDAQSMHLVVKKDAQLMVCNRYKAADTHELIYYLGYVLKSIWPDNHQQKNISVLAHNSSLDVDYLQKFYPNSTVTYSHESSPMLQLLSECV